MKIDAMLKALREIEATREASGLMRHETSAKIEMQNAILLVISKQLTELIEVISDIARKP